MPHPPPQHVPTLTEVVHEGKRLFQVPHPVPSEAGALATGETRGPQPDPADELVAAVMQRLRPEVERAVREALAARGPKPP